MADIEESPNFVSRNTRLAYRIDSLQREEIPEYPMAAIREGITNAIMHRDYFEVGANVFVEICSDRIEVKNPGGLPKGLTPATLGTMSVRRNPLIADLLHRAGLIEKAGTGIRRMREDAVRHGSPVPQFTDSGFFTATFLPLNLEKVTDEVRPFRWTDRTPEGAEEHWLVHPIEQVTEQVIEQVTEQVTEQVRTILEACRSGQARSDLQKALGIAHREHFSARFLRPLVAAGWMEMTIPDRPNSSKQRYRTTTAGVRALEEVRKRGGP